MIRWLFLGCMLASLPLAHTQARPVSYPGGWTLMQHNNQDMHSVHAHYSPSARYSIGYRAEYRRDEDWQFHGAQLNYLVKRWNAPASQANVYLKSAAGVAYSDYEGFDGKTEPAGIAGIALDWENRRYFTSYENHLYYAGDIDRFFMQKARVGFAPYVGDYGDLHTWLMLELEHEPEADDTLRITPLVRFFKGEYLAEAGISEDGEMLFNWIIRF